MTVIDFAAFIERLATAAGETILPFFRTSLCIENKNAGRDLDPVTEADRAAEATLFTTSPRLMNAADLAQFEKVEKQVRLSRYGGDCYAYCMLAAGHLDLVIETELKPYDVAALIPIVTGAGGIVTTWEGAPAQSGGRIIAAGDKRVHEAAMALLRA